MYCCVQNQYLKNLRSVVMSNYKCVFDEYQRLAESLGIDKLEPSKKCLVEELVKQASFLLVELDILKEQISTYGAIQINKNGRQKQTEASKHYNRTLSTLSSLMKNINTIIGKSNDDGDDELEKFIKGLS